MPDYVIKQAASLRGEARVSTGKNAVLPILACSLLTAQELTVRGVPKLTDVEHMLNILALCGVNIVRENDTVSLSAAYPKCPENAPVMRSMRASVLVLGPLMARIGEARLSLPGGCAIGRRPIDLHLKGMQAMGAQTVVEGGSMVVTGKLRGASVYLDFPSVGATENILMAAVLSQGTTRIENAAKEPEIIDLAGCLAAMGARIAGAGTGTIVVEGVQALHGAEYTPMPDRIEAGTLLCAVAAVGGSVRIAGARGEHLRSVLYKLQESGLVISEDDKGLHARGHARMPLEVRTLSYPGFPTDIQAPMMVTACRAKGISVFIETIFENRYMHVDELTRMGAKIRVDGRLAMVDGGVQLTGARVFASDLRASAALLIAGLCAEGETILSDQACHLMRGYDALEDKLRALGADIGIR